LSQINITPTTETAQVSSIAPKLGVISPTSKYMNSNKQLSSGSFQKEYNLPFTNKEYNLPFTNKPLSPQENLITSTKPLNVEVKNTK
jgi:hypothetical protein